MDRFIVISSDCHAGLQPEGYREYLDPQFREMFDLALPIQNEKIEQAESQFLVKEINAEWRKDIQQELTGAWDITERTKMLDSDGIAAEIIFPDGITERNTPPFGAGLSLPTKDIVPELQWAGARAHNRWLADLCANAPERHFGVAIVLLLWDVEEAVKEVKWAAENGLSNVMIPHFVTEHDQYNHPKYNPFWEICESLGVVINFHSGAAPMDHFLGKDFPNKSDIEFPGGIGMYVSEVMWWTYRPLNFLIWSGVFERYSKLKVAIAEAGTAWMLPHFLRMLDHNFTDKQFSAKLGDFRSHLSMSPSEYFKRNVGIGASCMPRADTDDRHAIGLKQIMWGSDYPHPEGSWPQTAMRLQETFGGLPEDEIADMLGENAIRFYGFDREKLKPIAERIGPKRSLFKTETAEIS